MADTLTTNYGWIMPQDQSSSNTWGVKLNANLQAIDAQVWTNTQAGQNVTVLSTASVAATYTFGNSLAPAGQQLRWQWAMDTTAESGTAIGSNLNLLAYDNTGAVLPTAATFSRTGGATFNGAVTFSGTAAFSQPVTFAPTQALNSGSLILHGPSTPTLWFSSTATLGGTNVIWGEILATVNEMDIIGPGQITGGVNRPGATIKLTADAQAGHGGLVTLNNTNALLIGATMTLGGGIIQCFDGTGSTTTIGQILFGGLGAHTLVVTVGPAGNGFSVAANGDFSVTDNALKPGGGPWAATSDARIKTVDGEYESGLAAVLALRPVLYRYQGNDGAAHDPSKSHIGLVAQEVEDVMPEMVTKGDGEIDGEKVNDLRTLDTTALVFALVNAVRELTAEIDALKAKLP